MPLVLLNKPFRVLSQFTTDGDKSTLADYVDIADVYPAGRLDFDSEGLLVLTDDGALQSRISHPRTKLAKIYLAQVEGVASTEQLEQLRRGVKLKDGMARALHAQSITQPAWLWPRTPPIRYRESVADSWIELSINEGRNRQVRRMTAAVGLPTLRLGRRAVGPWSVDAIAPGTHSLISTKQAWNELKALPNGRR
jgi:23S rRNA pseudouridine2457 synthase